MQRKKSSHFVAAYVQSGQGTLTYEGETYALSPGDIFLLHTNSQHQYYGDKKDPFTFMWCNATGILISYLINAYEMNSSIVIHAPQIQPLFEEMHEIYQGNTDADVVDIQCAVKFHEIIASAAQVVNAPIRSGNLAHQIKWMMDNNLKRSLTIQEIAGRLGYSEAHINRTFKAAYGETPYHYMLRTKLSSAQRLLQGTDLKVKQVAEFFGFNDEFHFSNAFYKQFGYRPKNVERKKIPE